MRCLLRAAADARVSRILRRILRYGRVVNAALRDRLCGRAADHCRRHHDIRQHQGEEITDCLEQLRQTISAHNNYVSSK